MKVAFEGESAQEKAEEAYRQIIEKIVRSHSPMRFAQVWGLMMRRGRLRILSKRLLL